mgnify:CR=1 FL=1|tara:strand:- start:256 stop:2127 length:1872 start_codon:yes stop_codon:yes gene_type:complete
MIKHNLREILNDIISYEKYREMVIKNIDDNTDIECMGFKALLQERYGSVRKVITYLAGYVNSRNDVSLGEMRTYLDRHTQFYDLYRILVMIKNDPRIKPYIKITQYGLKRNKRWSISTDVDIAQLNDIITTKNSKYKVFDLYKQIYNIEQRTQCTSTKLLSDSLYNAIDNTIDRMANGETDYLKQIARYEQIGNLTAVLNYRNNIAYDIKDVRNFTINSTGDFTYIPAHKKTELSINESDNSVWKKDSRQTMKFGKAIAKIFKHAGTPYISDATIQDLSQAVKSKYTFDAELKVVSGEDIRKYYHRDNYNGGQRTESLGNSCMRHDSCQEYFDIYVDNPDKVTMLIASTSNGIIGRALIWNTDEGDLVMDRIYGGELTINAMKEYAKGNGIVHKYRQNYSNTTDWVTSIGEMVNKEYNITLVNNSEFKPYMDTFKWCNDPSENPLKINNSDNGDFSLDSTEGGPTDMVRTEDGDLYHEDYCSYLEYGNYDGWYHNDDTSWCNWSDMTVHSDDVVMTQCGDYVWKDNDDLVELDNGKYYHSDHTMYSEYEERMILIEETVTCVINEEIHEDNCIHIDLCVVKIVELGFTQEDADYIDNEQDLNEVFTVTDTVTENDLIKHLLNQ